MTDATTLRLLAFFHPAWMVGSLALAIATARLGLRIRRRRGTAALVAHCQLRNDQRTFKLDRIVTLEPLEAASSEPTGRA